MNVRWNNKARSVPAISVQRKPRWIKTTEEKKSEKDMSFELFEKKRGWQIRYRRNERRCRRSEMMRKLTKIMREIVPQDRSTLRERSVWNSETRSISRTIKSDKRWGASRTIWCVWQKRTEIRRVTSLNRFVCERENFVWIEFFHLSWVSEEIFK